MRRFNRELEALRRLREQHPPKIHLSEPEQDAVDICNFLEESAKLDGLTDEPGYEPPIYEEVFTSYLEQERIECGLD
jgi:hypothetical protein